MKIFTAPSYKEKINNRFDYAICKQLLIKRIDGLWDYNGDLDLPNMNLKSFLDLPYQFHTIKGYLNCNFNKLTSLKGCPKIIFGSFYCYSNNLKSLKYSPDKIGVDWDITGNYITSLKGCQKTIYGNFYCNNNKLKSLKYCPVIVGKNFSCANNHLTSLEHGPKEVGGEYICYNNKNKFLIKTIKCKVKSIVYGCH